MDELNIFYNEFLNEASQGVINCTMNYNILFNTVVYDNGQLKEYKHNEDEMLPTLFIKNKKDFDILLLKYLDYAKKFYFNSFNEQHVDKAFYAKLFSNATYDDFLNPIEFLKKRICFFNVNDYDFSLNKHSKILDVNIESVLRKEPDFQETPYSVGYRLIEGETDVYDLPYIKFGIYDDKAYIYAIQNDKIMCNSKKFKRLFYKINSGVDMSNENNRDITPSFVIALTLLISQLKSNNINKIIVPTILLERYYAKERSIINQYNYLKKQYDDDFALNLLNENKEKHQKIQTNLTEKLINNFIRISSSFEGIEITDYLDTNNDITLNIGNEVITNNLFLEELYNMGFNNNSKKM